MNSTTTPSAPNTLEGLERLVFPSSCPDGWSVIWSVFVQCVVTTEQLVGFVFGILAILTWVAIHIVGLVMRYREYKLHGRPHSSFFLVHQSVADACNCTGAIFARQLGTQIVFGLVLLMMDGLAFIQYMVLRVIHSGLCSHKTKVPHSFWQKKRKKQPSKSGSVVKMVLVGGALTLGGYLTPRHLFIPTRDMTAPHTAGRVLLSVEEPDTELDFLIKLGYALGSLSTVMYWVNMIPAIMRVFNEKSFSREQFVMLVVKICANVFYVVSVLTQHSKEVLFVLHTLPWTVGRIGLAGLQLGLLLQIQMNAKRRSKGRDITEDVASLLKNEYKPLDDDEEDDDDVGDAGGGEDASEDSDLEKAKPWKPTIPPEKNTYIRKMKKIARHMSREYEDGDAGTDDCSEINTDVEGPAPSVRRPLLSVVRPELISSASDEEEPGSMDSREVQRQGMQERGLEDTPSDWDEDWESKEPLSEREVTDILAAEDDVMGGAVTVREPVGVQGRGEGLGRGNKEKGYDDEHSKAHLGQIGKVDEESIQQTSTAVSISESIPKDTTPVDAKAVADINIVDKGHIDAQDSVIVTKGGPGVLVTRQGEAILPNGHQPHAKLPPVLTPLRRNRSRIPKVAGIRGSIATQREKTQDRNLKSQKYCDGIQQQYTCDHAAADHHDPGPAPPQGPGPAPPRDLGPGLGRGGGAVQCSSQDCTDDVDVHKRTSISSVRCDKCSHHDHGDDGDGDPLMPVP